MLFLLTFFATLLGKTLGSSVSCSASSYWCYTGFPRTCPGFCYSSNTCGVSSNYMSSNGGSGQYSTNCQVDGAGSCDSCLQFKNCGWCGGSCGDKSCESCSGGFTQCPSASPTPSRTTLPPPFSCSGGQYNTNGGTTSSSCTQCAAGSFSSSGATVARHAPVAPLPPRVQPRLLPVSAVPAPHIASTIWLYPHPRQMASPAPKFM